MDATKPARPVVFPVRARVPEASVAAADPSAATDVTAEALPWTS